MSEPASVSRKAIVCLVSTVVSLAVNLCFELHGPVVPIVAAAFLWLLLLALFLGMIGIREIDGSQGHLGGRKLIWSAYLLTILFICISVYVIPIYFFLQDAKQRAKETQRQREPAPMLPAKSDIK